MSVEPLESLFDEFAAAHARGEHPDVAAFVERAGEQRDELGRMIDALLQAAPVQPPDERVLAALRERVAEPRLLRLRRTRGLHRSTVVSRLRGALGLPLAAENRLAVRYHELETDLLDPTRVGGKVWAALREVFGEDVRPLVGLAAPPATPAAAFFREAEPAHAVAPGAPAREPRREDVEVDRLFGVER